MPAAPPKREPTPEVFQPWIEDVKRVTEGRVDVRILPKPVGGPAQHWELVRKGIADITWGNFTYEPDRFKALWFSEMPFIGTNAEASSVALWETYEKYLAGKGSTLKAHLKAIDTAGDASLARRVSRMLAA